VTFVDRARAVQQGRKGGHCTAGLLLDSLPADYRVEVDVALADPAIYTSSIAELMSADGHEIGVQNLNRHRRGRCMCR